MADIRITPGSSIMNFTSSLNYVETLKQDASGSLNLYGSGSTGRTELFSIDGNNGRLFTVSDDLSDSLFSVNTIAGLPVIEAFANNTVVMGQYGTNALVVSGSKVGIGTTSPSEKLDVNGYVKATGFKTPSGTATQFLMADGSTNSNTYAKTDGTGATGTWGINITGNANTANTATNASYLTTNYAGGQQLNPQTYFNNNVGVKVAMTAAAGVWSDTLWINGYNGYNGGDVPSMCALHFQRNGTPRMYISTQNSTATSYGTLYEVLSNYGGTGTYSTTGDFRAPIFYDSNNTGYYLDPASTSNLLDVTTNSLGVGTAAPRTAGLIRATNDIVAYYSSDRRLKDNITPISNPLEKISQIGGYEFDWNNNQDVYKGHDIGVIAQEIEEVLPEIVETRDNGYKAVKYEKIVPLLIEAIKEQQKQIDELKELIKNK